MVSNFDKYVKWITFRTTEAFVSQFLF